MAPQLLFGVKAAKTATLFFAKPVDLGVILI